jgi:hypothetical protein
MQNQTQIRVPVLDVNGNPTMPTKASRARRWLRDGEAKVVHNDLGVFQIQLLQEASGTEQQDVVVGIDQGKLFTGMAVQSSKFTLLMLHLELPFLTVKKCIEQRAMMRRTRRCRRIHTKVKFKLRNHRQQRYKNRKNRNKLPPSIKANKCLERRVITELLKIFPVTDFVFEEIKARGTKGFSPVMQGQNIQINWLKSIASVSIIGGWKTSILRDKLGLVKNKSNKSIQKPATHAIDGVALACHHFIKYVDNKVNQCADWFGSVEVTKSQFVVLSRPSYSRRQLHYFQFSKGGKRKRHGGSTTIKNFRKGDLIKYQNKDKVVIGYCSGFTNNGLSISDHNWSIISRSCGLVKKAGYEYY